VSAVRIEDLVLRSPARVTTQDGYWHVTDFGVLLRETMAF